MNYESPQKQIRIFIMQYINEMETCTPTSSTPPSPPPICQQRLYAHTHYYNKFLLNHHDLRRLLCYSIHP